jgi:hypothetical protein
MTETRTIHAIAGDIKRIWKKMYFGAVPYVDAMLTLSVRGDHYGLDSSDDILLHFFSNASAFRGDEAKALKYELVQHLSPSYQKEFLGKYKPKATTK